MSYISIRSAFRQLCELYYKNQTNIVSVLYTESLLTFYNTADNHILYNVIVSHSFDAVINTRLINYTANKNKHKPRDELSAFLKVNKILLLVVNLAASLENAYPELVMEYAMRSRCRESILKQLKMSVNYELNIIDCRDLDDQRLLTKFLSNLKNVNISL